MPLRCSGMGIRTEVLATMGEKDLRLMGGFVTMPYLPAWKMRGFVQTEDAGVKRGTKQTRNDGAGENVSHPGSWTPSGKADQL